MVEYGPFVRKQHRSGASTSFIPPLESQSPPLISSRWVSSLKEIVKKSKMNSWIFVLSISVFSFFLCIFQVFSLEKNEKCVDSIYFFYPFRNILKQICCDVIMNLNYSLNFSLSAKSWPHYRTKKNFFLKLTTKFPIETFFNIIFEMESN